MSAGTIADVGDNYGSFDVSNAAIASVGALFGGQWSSKLPATGKMVMMGEDTEKSSLGAAEYTVYVSAFFDGEAAARAVFESQVSRYSCAKTTVKDSTTVTAPKVLWGYPYPAHDSSSEKRTWYVAVCPNYYCSMVTDAGGSLLTGASQTLTDSQFAALASQADVFFYTGSNWASEMAPYLPGGVVTGTAVDTSLVDILASIPAVKSTRVYDILKMGVSAWFEVRPASPEALFQDLYRVLQPLSAYTSGLTAPNVFLRNVFKDAIGTLPATTSCSSYHHPASYLLSTSNPACSATSASSPSPPYAIIFGALGGSIAALAIGAVVVKKMLCFKSSAKESPVPVLSSKEAPVGEPSLTSATV